MLVLDSFSVHITPAVKQKLKDINTVPVVIPGSAQAKYSHWMLALASHLSPMFVVTGLNIFLNNQSTFRTSKS